MLELVILHVTRMKGGLCVFNSAHVDHDVRLHALHDEDMNEDALHERLTRSVPRYLGQQEGKVEIKMMVWESPI